MGLDMPSLQAGPESLPCALSVAGPQSFNELINLGCLHNDGEMDFG